MQKNGPFAGVSLLDSLVSLILIVITLLSLIAGILTSISLQQQNRELSLAMNMARTYLSQIEQYNCLYGLVESFNTYTSNAYQFFDVPGLSPSTGSPEDSSGTKRVGYVAFPTKPGNTLNEDELASWGREKDLDGNGSVNTSVSPSDLVWLPLRIIIRWRGKTGNREWILSSTLPKRPTG